MPEKYGNRLPLSLHDKSPYDIAVYAAGEAGKVLRRRFGLQNEIRVKGRRNLVTEADIRSEKKILEIIREEYPRHRILSEESGDSQPGAEYMWIIDPLDGTNNYYFGIPYFCINIALAKGKEVLLGLTYDPIRRETFHSEKGKGSFLNGKRIHVSGVNSLQAASVGVDLGYQTEQGNEILRIAVKLWPKIHCLRLMGSASLGLAYVACGRLSLYFHKHLYPWDIASGLLLIREAGGTVMNGNKDKAEIEDKEIIAANKKLVKQFLSWLERS